MENPTSTHRNFQNFICAMSASNVLVCVNILLMFYAERKSKGWETKEEPEVKFAWRGLKANFKGGKSSRISSIHTLVLWHISLSSGATQTFVQTQIICKSSPSSAPFRQEYFIGNCPISIMGFINIL